MPSPIVNGSVRAKMKLSPSNWPHGCPPEDHSIKLMARPTTSSTIPGYEHRPVHQTLLAWAGAPANVCCARSLSQVTLSSPWVRPGTCDRVDFQDALANTDIDRQRSAQAGPPSRQ